MEKEFIPYTEALELKQLGFNERCYGCFSHLDNRELWTSRVYTNGVSENIAAPTFSQAFRWFREKYQLFSWVKVEYEYGGYSCGIYITGVRQSDIANGPYSTYEKAELACLQKLIEIVKTK